MRVWNWFRDSGNQGALASLALLVGGAWAVFLYIAPVDGPPTAVKDPVPSAKPITRSRLSAQLEPITVKYYPGNRSYIVVGTTVTVKNTSQQALQMAVHSLSLQLGDGTTLLAKRVEGAPICLHGLSFNCERVIRSSEAISPDSDLAINVEFSKAVGPHARIARTGTASLSGAMWTLDADDSNAEFKQSPLHAAGIEQEFMLD